MSDIWDNSSFLDLTGYGVTTTTTPEQAFGITGSQTATSDITVALVLPRLNDPTALLGESWAQREATLNGLTPTQVGALYGADPTQYDALKAYLSTVSGAKVMTSTPGYVSNAASRTLWVSLNAQAFKTLFGQTLLSPKNNSFNYWDGTLTPNPALGPLGGLWIPDAPVPNATPQYTKAVGLREGPQGIGNTAGGGYGSKAPAAPSQDLYPNQIASEYNFPLTTSGVATPTIGLVEPGIGTAVAAGSDPNQLIQQYRASAGITGTGTISNGPDQAAYGVPTKDERSLDVGVVATTAPNSNIVADAGGGDLYSTMEEAIWGGGAKLSDLSSSFTFGSTANPASPFFAAQQGLYQDAALNNISFFQDSGDGGSSGERATGLPHVDSSSISPYAVSVGGTSTSSQAQVAAAGAAHTGGVRNINAGIAALARRAEHGSVAALETLAAGGLTQKPTATSNIADFLQTTWNGYLYNASTHTLTNPYDENYSSGGGVDTAIPEPSYQANAGIDTQALGHVAGIPNAASGKGDPDVSALAGGNSHYIVPTPNLTGTQYEGGTSAATPLWAAFAAQVQAVFANEGLPTTGYFNDLLYQAATIDPGSFNDVRFGSNTSSYYNNPNGKVTQKDTNGATHRITPTGLGYSAGPGYDLTTGLGTPDGILLARALTQVAQAEIYSPDATPVTDGTGMTSDAAQALIVQPTLTRGFAGAIHAGGTVLAPKSDGSGHGWSAQIAQQSLQSTFSPALAEAIAGQAQASSRQIDVANGQALSVKIGRATATPTAQADTSPFGYVTYDARGQSVTLARPLAVAQTYGGQNDTNAIVRIRQDSSDADSLSFYRVDNLQGTIDGIAPGQAGYAAAAASRAYGFTGGATSVAGPGDGQFLQTDLTGVNNGDIIACKVTNATTGKTSWGLASQNTGDANALWSYGADTWGFDDGSAGGRGFDSMVFQLDFTSNAGSGLLADDAPLCLSSGTLIRTVRGDFAVEDLRVGDLAVTASGELRPITWLGHRTIDCTAHATPWQAWPVRVLAGAFGDGLPVRDLYLSPGHPVLVGADADGEGGDLVPIMCLINGTTIERIAVDEVTYWHVELDAHDVLLAEGLPAESYLDTGGRGFFTEGSVDELQNPDFVVPGLAGRCRPVALDGPVVEVERRRLDMIFATRLAGACAWPDRDAAAPAW